MSKVKDFILRVYNLCKDLVLTNGVEGVVGLLLGLLLWSLGQKIFAGIAFGIFFTRNWDLFKGWVLSKLK